jgi:hypothetical protein
MLEMTAATSTGEALCVTSVSNQKEPLEEILRKVIFVARYQNEL